MQKIFGEKMAAVGLEVRTQGFAAHRSTSTPTRLLWLRTQNIARIKKWNKYFDLEKKYKIWFVGNTDARNWVKFGHPVTSIFVKKSKKNWVLRIFFDIKKTFVIFF